MPYRRLPNTDVARLRALKTALEMVNTVSPKDLLYSQKLLLSIKAFVPVFEQSMEQYTTARRMQIDMGKAVAETSRNARLYLSHFIQVFNMCIARGEIKPEMRDMLGLDDATLPDISSDAQLLEIGERVIAGEERRGAMGVGNRIYNPSIAVVKVKFSQFKENYNKYRDIIQTKEKHKEKFVSMREKADILIVMLWNEIESSMQPIDTDEKRNICQQYGVVYVYRPMERQRAFLNF